MLGIRNQKGVTLVELILATLVLIIIVGVLSRILSKGLDSIDYGNQETELRQNGRVALSRMSREIRQALATPVESGQGKTITFTADINNDDTSETIIYSWDGTAPPNGDLVRTEAGTPAVMIDDCVKRLKFKHREKTTTIELTLEKTYGDRTYTVTLRSAVFLRKDM